MFHLSTTVAVFRQDSGAFAFMGEKYMPRGIPIPLDEPEPPDIDSEDNDSDAEA